MKTSLFHKIVLCLLAGLLCFFGFQADLNHHLPDLVHKCLVVVCAGLVLVSVLFIPLWHFREKKQRIDSEQTLAFLQGLIIYVEAYVFFKFGLLKLLNLHMTSSLILSDMPGDSLSGYHLMDYFFGRAPLFKLIIGWLQLAGASLLLFRKTRLAAIFVLMPVIVNIVCMDILYEVGQVTLVAVLLLAGLVYLLVQEREKLIRLFLDAQSTMPVFRFRNNISRHVLRFSAFAIPFLVLAPAIKPLSNAGILGKYTVTSLTINKRVIPIDMNNDSLLTTVYFDQNETCMLRFNDYRKIQIGKAIYDGRTEILKVLWRYPQRQSDTTELLLSGKGDEKTLAGVINGDTITARLVKTPLPAVVIK